MKNKILFPILLGLITIISSCSTSNDVASNGLIQKRKYNKGYHINNGNDIAFKTKKIAITKNEEIVAVDEQTIENIKTTNENINESIIELNSPNEFVNVDAEKNNVTKKSDIKKNSAESTVNESQLVITESKNINKKSKIKNLKTLKAESQNSSGSGGDMMILLIILAFLLPWLAVGIYTNWDLMKTLIALLLWFLFIFPGIIYALLVIFDII